MKQSPPPVMDSDDMAAASILAAMSTSKVGQPALLQSLAQTSPIGEAAASPSSSTFDRDEVIQNGASSLSKLQRHESRGAPRGSRSSFPDIKDVDMDVGGIDEDESSLLTSSEDDSSAKSKTSRPHRHWVDATHYSNASGDVGSRRGIRARRNIEPTGSLEGVRESDENDDDDDDGGNEDDDEDEQEDGQGDQERDKPIRRRVQHEDRLFCPRKECASHGGFRREYDYERHFTTTHTNTAWDCPMKSCDLSFSRRDSLLRHVRAHQEREARAKRGRRQK